MSLFQKTSQCRTVHTGPWCAGGRSQLQPGLLLSQLPAQRRPGHEGMSAVPAGAAASRPGTQPVRTLEPSPGAGSQVGRKLCPLLVGTAPAATLGPRSLDALGAGGSCSDVLGGWGAGPFLKQAQRPCPPKAREKGHEGMARASRSGRPKRMTAAPDEETARSPGVGREPRVWAGARRRGEAQ